MIRVEGPADVSPADLHVLEVGLRASAELEWQRQPYDPLAFLARDERGTVIGGIIGNTGGPWFYISAVWVAEHLRRQGLGRRLMDAAETEAVARGCTGAYLDTFSDAASAFYRARGYECFGELEGGPREPVRQFLRRRLIAGNRDNG
jgi:GNAT superfamily N-acetyltransferase